MWRKKKKKLLDEYLRRKDILERGEEEELISDLQEKLERSRREIKELLEKL